MSPPFGLGLGLGLDGVSAAASSPYVPGTISSMVLALEAGRGGFVTDQSGKGNNFAATGSPTVTAGAGPNGTSGITLDGSTQYFSRNGSMGQLGPGFTSIMIAKLSSTTAISTGVFSAAGTGENDYSGANGLLTWSSGATSGGAPPTGLECGAAGVYTGVLSLGMDAWHCVRLEMVAATKVVNVYADGVFQASVTSVVADNVTPVVWAIGARYIFGSISRLAKVTLGAAYVMNATLAGANKTALAADISTRFGLTL